MFMWCFILRENKYECKKMKNERFGKRIVGVFDYGKEYEE